MYRTHSFIFSSHENTHADFAKAPVAIKLCDFFSIQVKSVCLSAIFFSFESSIKQLATRFGNFRKHSNSNLDICKCELDGTQNVTFSALSIVHPFGNMQNR